MPFINVHIGKPMSEEKKVEVMKMIADNMPIIPGKTVDNTMIELSADLDMYMGGEKRELIFVDMRVMKPAPMERKDQFVAALSEGFDKLLGIPANKQYYTIAEFNEWGHGGHFTD